MKKQNTAAAAQNLIDSLLDELPSSTEIRSSTESHSSEDEAVIRRGHEKTRTLEISADQENIAHLALDISKPNLLKDDPVAAAEKAFRARQGEGQAQGKPASKPEQKPETKPLTEQIAKHISAPIVVDNLDDEPFLNVVSERGTDAPFEFVAPPPSAPKDPKAGLRYHDDQPSLKVKDIGDDTAESFDHSRHAIDEMKHEPERDEDRDRDRLGANDFASALLSSDPFSDNSSDSRTVKLNVATVKATEPNYDRESFIDRAAPTEIRLGGMHQRPFSQPSPASGAGAFSSAEAALKQSESLRFAQSKINELEAELERVRRENEQLATAGETLKRRSDELLTRTEAVETQAREAQRIYDEEKKVLRGQLAQKDRESAELRSRLDEMENRLESNFMKIRVRERELEHRLEIVKMESATLVSTKDKMILDLKRQIDQLTHENEYGKQKTQELFNQYKDKQETIRRVVRALRIALTILEGDEENGNPLKKAE
jgi:hypothetical protein